MFRSVVEIGFDSESAARKALGAMSAEMPEHSRSKAKLEVDGSTLRLQVDANDAVALRASLNTYLRLISVVLAGLREGV